MRSKTAWEQGAAARILHLLGRGLSLFLLACAAAPSCGLAQDDVSPAQRNRAIEALVYLREKPTREFRVRELRNAALALPDGPLKEHCVATIAAACHALGDSAGGDTTTTYLAAHFPDSEHLLALQDLSGTQFVCGTCGGEGRVRPRCPTCHGTGAVLRGGRAFMCRACNGRGWVAQECPTCRGRGFCVAPASRQLYRDLLQGIHTAIRKATGGFPDGLPRALIRDYLEDEVNARLRESCYAVKIERIRPHGEGFLATVREARSEEQYDDLSGDIFIRGLKDGAGDEEELQGILYRVPGETVAVTIPGQLRPVQRLIMQRDGAQVHIQSEVERHEWVPEHDEHVPVYSTNRDEVEQRLRTELLAHFAEFLSQPEANHQDGIPRVLEGGNDAQQVPDGAAPK